MKNHLIISLIVLLFGCSTSEKQSNKKSLIEHIKEYDEDNSIVDFFSLSFDSGAQIDIYCENLEETSRIKESLTEGLSVSILSAETKRWLDDRK